MLAYSFQRKHDRKRASAMKLRLHDMIPKTKSSFTLFQIINKMDNIFEIGGSV